MRLAYCYRCEDMAPLPDYKGNPDYDVVLQDWIERHLHGFGVEETGGGEQHPGARVFQVDDSVGEIDRRVVRTAHAGRPTVDRDVLGELSADEMAAVQVAREELRKIGKEINEYRDDLRIDATECHRRHGQPSFPGKPCIDYQADSKRLGRKDTPKAMRQYLCTYCPYESTVTVAKRAQRGDYALNRPRRR